MVLLAVSCTFIKDTITLFSMLASADNPKSFKLKSYKKAINYYCDHQKDWQKAMQNHIDSLTKNNTWLLSTLFSESRVLKVKWVYKIKCGLAGKILRFKVRWVIKGFF